MRRESIAWDERDTARQDECECRDDAVVGAVDQLSNVVAGDLQGSRGSM